MYNYVQLFLRCKEMEEQWSSSYGLALAISKGQLCGHCPLQPGQMKMNASEFGCSICLQFIYCREAWITGNITRKSARGKRLLSLPESQKTAFLAGDEKIRSPEI